MARQERAFKGGTRVRIEAPGYSFHGSKGTVAQDTSAEGVCFVLRDGRPCGPDRPRMTELSTAEVARLRDQTPNPEHGEDFSDFWWVRRDA